MVSSHSCLPEDASLILRGIQSFTFCSFVAVHILLLRFRDQVRLGQPSSLLFPVPMSYLKKCFTYSLTISYMSITCLGHLYSQSPPLTPHPNALYDHCHTPGLYNPLSPILLPAGMLTDFGGWSWAGNHGCHEFMRTKASFESLCWCL